METIRVFKVETKIADLELPGIYFHEEKTVKAFCSAITQILTPEGKKEVEFTATEVEVYDHDTALNEILLGYKSILDDNEGK